MKLLKALGAAAAMIATPALAQDVQIDETLDPNAETPATEADAAALIERAKTLLAPAEAGTEFQKNYFLALQQSPDVVLLHSEVMKLLGR